MGAAATPSPWIEIALDRAGGEVRVTAIGSSEEREGPFTLTFDSKDKADAPAWLEGFADSVRKRAARGKPPGELLDQAQALHDALVSGPLNTLLARIEGAAADEPVLVRFHVHESLQAVPWEAICAPETSRFWASDPQRLPCAA